jgi:hypothetical protein
MLAIAAEVDVRARAIAIIRFLTPAAPNEFPSPGTDSGRAV